MKSFIHTHIVLLFAVLLWTGDVMAAFPQKSRKKSQTSCSIFRGKNTASDQIEYHIGVTAGRNVATMKSKRSDSQDVITGFAGGVAFQAIWPKGFVFQPELLYSQKGCITGYSMQYDIDYLEMPVKLMYRLYMADVKPFAYIAPYGAYAFRLNEYGDPDLSDDAFSNQVKRWDAGIGAGAGFDVWKLQLSFKYTWGFTSVLNELVPVRNKVFTVSAGFFF